MREKRGLFVWSFGAENFVPRHSFFCLAPFLPPIHLGRAIFFAWASTDIATDNWTGQFN